MTFTLIGHGGLTLVGTQTSGPRPGSPPVLLLHGGGQTRHAWGGTAEALAARGFSCHCLDLRGHGESDWSPGGDYSLAAYLGDVEAAARHCGAPPIGVGASLGGIILLLAAARLAPGTLAGLVLVDIAPRMEPAGVARIVGFMTAYPEGFLSVEAAADAIAAYLPHRERPRDLRGLAKNLRQREDGRFVWHWDARLFTPGNLAAQADAKLLEEAARALHLPTLLVRGGLSDLLSDEGVAEFRALAPHAEFADVRGAHHMVVGDQNDAFTAAVDDFLTRRFGRG